MAVLDLQQLLSIACVEPYAGFEISPDGTQLAFSWNITGQWEIYMQPLQPVGRARQVTSGPGAKMAPRFSPDGKTLAYALDLNGSEALQICLCELDSGRQTQLLAAEPEAAFQPNLAWSPDGSRLAFISNRSGRFSTYIAPVNPVSGYPALPQDWRLVCDQGGPNWDVRWSPRGDWLAVVAESRGQDYAIYLAPVPPVGGEESAGMPVVPLQLNGALVNARDAAWARDGRRLAFAADFSGDYGLGLFDVDTQQLSALPAPGPGMEKTAPIWSPDGKRLAYVLSQGPQTWLAVFDLESGRQSRYQVEPGEHYLPAFSPDGCSLLFVFDSPRRPDDLWRLELDSGRLEQLTNSLPAGLAPEDFSLPTHITYPAPDGQMVPALLYLPGPVSASGDDGDGQTGLPPAVVVIHGGPNWRFQFLWYPLMSHLASRGWTVLAPNYRGSTGYGAAWQTASRFEMGRLDTLDVVAGADYLERERLADPRRIAVTGRSHGGFLTMSCLTQAPQRWAAGSAVVPFLNWFTSHANSRQDLQHWDIENMGDPETHRDLWQACSPFFYLEQVQAPVQLICGANDPRCPASESIQARDMLQALDKPVDFILYPDEGHTFLKTENVVDHELRRVAFLAKYLEE